MQLHTLRWRCSKSTAEFQHTAVAVVCQKFLMTFSTSMFHQLLQLAETAFELMSSCNAIGRRRSGIRHCVECLADLI